MSLEHEAELIEKLNDIDATWREDFDDVWTAADYYQLINTEELFNHYLELDFDE